MELSHIGLIGLAVMGENLALNMERNGFRVSVYNRSAEQVDRFMNGRAAGKRFAGHKDIASFVASLERPRKIVMMIKAGAPVDQVIDQLLPHLEEGDILIDGGNSNYIDTERRVESLRTKGILFVGCGISGGEEGALNGPSIMPGGAVEARPHVMPILQKIAAVAKEDGAPCCNWVGGGGSGHFVKMIHNGIEYGDMQLISEAYFIMKKVLNYDNDHMADIFATWNKGVLESYLVEITSDILRRKDEATGTHLIDIILDAAGQKGTGKWSVINSLEYGIPLNLISTAVYERSISALKGLRTEAAELYNLHLVPLPFTGEPVKKIETALYASKLVSYAQGFQLMAEASAERGWDLNLSDVARLWRGGCIIRSSFLNKIAEAYERNAQLAHLLFDEYFKSEMIKSLEDWREVVSLGARVGLPIPAYSSALNYFHSLTTARLSANMIQAQRDYFGAHMFERVDRPRGEFFHEDWVGLGGDAESTVYTV